ncbi:MAG TPA: T9SS type A sorting domain-containing protein [Bacteroidetes bacterium]|nr:T9SS type A sorting domain-containing protein [Bacteroidota bacterium]HEX03972.1 T9SS type A sorting domain-containing protein [Bacteroidota bacterium]
MSKRFLRLTILVAAFLVCFSALAELRVTDEAGLKALSERLTERYLSMQGPEYQRLKAIRTGYWGELNADPERELVGVEKDGTPVIMYTSNVNAARTIRVNQVNPGGITGYDLNGSTAWGLAVWDNGVTNPNNPEFAGRSSNGDGTSNYEAHANHTSGTLAAAGINVNARGMAYGTTLTTFDWAMDQQEMASSAHWLKVSSHSYSSGGQYSEYTWLTAGFDEIAYLAPNYLICQAAANDGPGWSTIASSNLGKNVLTVGAVNDVLNYTGPGSVSLAGFSSRGPTQDGRIKPDVVGNGVQLYSTLSTGYTSMSGTSMSTPNVAGGMFLLAEHYQNTHSWQPLPSATSKALAIHTADECGGADGPDYKYGWGLLNIRAAADMISADVENPDLIQQLVLTEGELFSYEFVADGSTPLRATIAWTEPASDPGANPVLINDLDMRIVRVSDGTDWQPYVLNPNDPSQTAFTGDNDLDNVEQVYVANPTAGVYQVQVLNDGELLDGSQDFSLIVSGVFSSDTVSLSLDPEEIQVGDGGGVITFDATLVNYTDTVFSGLQFWTMANLPNGEDYGLLFTSQPFTLDAQATVTSPMLSQSIPSYAPNGTYSLIGFVGEYPDVMVQDSFEFSKGVMTGIDDDPIDGWGTNGDFIASDLPLPDSFSMEQAWPNPFNSETRIRVNLSHPAQLHVAVYDIQGRRVRVLAEEDFNAGRHEFSLSSDGLSSGVYFIRATLDGESSVTQKLIHVQ